MNSQNYQNLALKTEPNQLDYTYTLERLNQNVRLLHGAIGLCTESGELIDSLKKYIYYNKPLDIINLKEEIGDVLWYIALLCNALDCSMEEIMDTNIAKLKLRYENKFTEDSANNRNLEEERSLLEKMS